MNITKKKERKNT